MREIKFLSRSFAALTLVSLLIAPVGALNSFQASRGDGWMSGAISTDQALEAPLTMFTWNASDPGSPARQFVIRAKPRIQSRRSTATILLLLATSFLNLNAKDRHIVLDSGISTSLPIDSTLIESNRTLEKFFEERQFKNAVGKNSKDVDQIQDQAKELDKLLKMGGHFSKTVAHLIEAVPKLNDINSQKIILEEWDAFNRVSLLKRRLYGRLVFINAANEKSNITDYRYQFEMYQIERTEIISVGAQSINVFEGRPFKKIGQRLDIRGESRTDAPEIVLDLEGIEKDTDDIFELIQKRDRLRVRELDDALRPLARLKRDEIFAMRRRSALIHELAHQQFRVALGFYTPSNTFGLPKHVWDQLGSDQRREFASEVVAYLAMIAGARPAEDFLVADLEVSLLFMSPDKPLVYYPLYYGLNALAYGDTSLGINNWQNGLQDRSADELMRALLRKTDLAKSANALASSILPGFKIPEDPGLRQYTGRLGSPSELNFSASLRHAA